MIRLPIAFRAEYRGVQAGFTFSDRETGQPVDVAPALKFEYEDEDGDVVLIPIRGSMLDKCEPPFNYGALTKGTEVILTGNVVIQEKGSTRDSYFQIKRVEVFDQKPVKAA